jgi:activator of 2-hydroxyglutaryl-CoA dehydratase
MTGGVVAHNPLLVRLAEQAFERTISVPPEPQCIGALGAALFAMQQNEPTPPPS